MPWYSAVGNHELVDASGVNYTRFFGPSGATKPATLSTGAVVNVPLFVQEGEWVKIDTREGTYLERVNRR